MANRLPVRQPHGGRPPLNRDRIAHAAMELLDEIGLAALSTRRLAAKLGIQSASLYWHVRNKDELLDLTAEAICADAFSIDEAAPWREQLASGLRQFRRLLRAHRDAATLLRQRPPTGPNRLRHIDTTVRILLGAGFTADEAAGISRLLAAHVLASVSDQPRQPEPGSPFPELDDFPHLQRVVPAYARMDDEKVFDLGCEIILDGLARRARNAKSPRASS